MATAKKQLAATVAAGAKKPAARPAATPAPRPATNALTVDPRTVAPRPANPFQTAVGGLLPAVRQTVGTAVRALPPPQPAPTGGLMGIGQALAGPLGALPRVINPAIQAGVRAVPMAEQLAAQQRAQAQMAEQLRAQAQMDALRQQLYGIPGGLQGVGPRQMPSFMTQVLQDPMEMQRKQAAQAAMFARDLQMGRTGGMTQEAFAAQQAAERQRYAQQLQAQEMARQAGMSRPGQVPYLVNDMIRPGQVPYLGGPTGLGSAGPMQRPVGGMPGFGGDPRFPGPGQMPQISGRLPGGAYAQQGPTTQAQPRPAAPSNYGGFNSIQGMGANQYGGFNTPPMPQQQFAQNQAGLGQMQNQQQFAQNQAGNMFGSFGAAAQPAQNQGPNQQAQAAGQAAAPLAGGLF